MLIVQNNNAIKWQFHELFQDQCKKKMLLQNPIFKNALDAIKIIKFIGTINSFFD
ncbi:hypothetical protein LX64_02952 [Chitinophaga skermanii]|uniref:Uncharacterized protein n=1 Tax=Chitinophaga skermanii TaxID=331697 RepID=A0A327QJA6_9BACT|nr:hypothetical protein LX64_02952 [Chitinophaga skermanii]